MTSPADPEEQGKRHALVESGALIVKSAARGVLVLAVYAVVGALFHWTAFALAAGDIWSNFHAGPGGAHGGGMAIVFFVILLFTAPGLVTLVYVLGLPLVCLLLGKREAIHAAVHRALRDKRAALGAILTDIAWRAVTVAGAVPGAAHGGAAVKRLRGAVEATEGSRASRFLLRAVARAVHLEELVGTTDFMERAKTDPGAVRATLAAAIEPRLDALGAPPSYRPLVVVLAFTAIATLTRGLWCGLL